MKTCAKFGGRSMKFTPGPWKSPSAGIWSESGIMVASCGSEEVVGSMKKTGMEYPEITEMIISNCELIAAAPALLEALEYVVQWHRDHDSGEGELSGLDYVTTCIAAISKAKGK